MDESGERAPARAVLELELDLDHPVAGAHRVDRHADLHAETVRERQHVFERAAGQRALPGDRRAVRRPPVRLRIAQRAKPSASPKPPPTRLAKPPRRCRPRRRRPHRPAGPARAAESPRSPSQRTKTDLESGSACVAAEGSSAGAGASRSASRAARVKRRPCRTRAPLRTTRAPGASGDLGGGVARAVVGDPDGRAGKRAGERGERRRDALGLVVGADDDRVGARGSVGGAIYCPGPIVLARTASVPAETARMCGGSDD